MNMEISISPHIFGRYNQQGEAVIIQNIKLYIIFLPVLILLLSAAGCGGEENGGGSGGDNSHINGSDTTAPSTPAKLAATPISDTRIDLSWDTSTDDVGVTGYNIYRCAGSCTPTTFLITSTTNSYSDAGLTAETTYTYTVSAYDAAGNESVQSSSASAATQTQPQQITTGPVLLFSDLTSGAKTGWEGSATKGAAVTVWGRNFGSTRGTNYITVNGAQITEYAEWGITGTENGIPKGLERITFWLNNNCADALGKITVTVDGAISNALPFTVRGGNIYFVSVYDGDDSYNGQYDTDQGGGNGPWKSPKMFLPSNNGVIKPGDIVYVRSGTYTDQSDNDGYMIRLRNDDGSSGNEIALVGYPEDIANNNRPNLGNNLAGIKLLGTEHATGYSSYFVFSKIEWRAAAGDTSGSYGTAMHLCGNNIRVVGNQFTGSTSRAWSGIIDADYPQYIYVYGNYFYGNGYDKFKHDIYFRANHDSGLGGGDSKRNMEYIYIGWNEFSNSLGNVTTTENDMGGTSVDLKSQGSGNHQYIARYLYIHDNYWHDGTEEALRLTDKVGDAYIFNNIIENMGYNGYDGLQFILRGDEAPLPNFNVYLYNNLLYQNNKDKCVNHRNDDNAKQQVYSYNNIFYCDGGTAYFDSYFGSSGTSWTDKNSIYYGSGSPPSGTNVLYENTISEDPQFENIANHDFHITSSSPAIDSGTSDVSLTVTTDYDNNPRPIDGNDDGTAEYDIGAYEYIPTGP